MPPTQDLAKFLRRQFARADSRTQAFLSKYGEVESKVASRIMEALLTRRLNTLRERRRTSSEIQALLRILYTHNEANAGNLISQFFQTGQRSAQLGTGEKVLNSQAQSQALKILTDNLVFQLNSAITTVGRRTEDVFRKEGLRSAIAVTAGVDHEVGSQTMRDALVRSGVTSFVDVTGRRWTLESYSTMATKTITAEAYNLAMQMSMLEKGFDLLEINSVTNPCKDCKPWDGKLVSLTGRAPGVPKLTKIPPFHPNCRHYLMAVPQTIAERTTSLEVGAI